MKVFSVFAVVAAVLVSGKAAKINDLKRSVSGAALFSYSGFTGTSGVLEVKVANHGTKVKLTKEQQKCCQWTDVKDTTSPLYKAGFTSFSATAKGFNFKNSKSQTVSCTASSGEAGTITHIVRFTCSPTASGFKQAPIGTDFWHSTSDGVPAGWKSEWGEFSHAFYAIVPNGFYGCSGLSTDGYCEDPFYYGWTSFNPDDLLPKKL